jgi:glyoxylase-like metal-dependent hydrolase (beta-lactamase superfamily II)/rhodanese-related sulfurtransferase
MEVPAERAGVVAPVEIVPFVDQGLGNSSYLVGLGDRRALVLDPVRDIRPYLETAGARGWSIVHAVETHLHADFVSGSRALATEGATVVAPRESRLAFPNRGLGDGDELDLGGLRLRAIGTPGHTPEHLGYLLLDGSRPVALFSGGALLPAGVARTDLIAPEETEPLARALFRALRDRMLTLPDDLPVYPTHGAGSFCSTGDAAERTTTIGRERASNPLLAAPTEEEFVARLLGSYGTFPAYFLRLREVNRRGPRVYAAVLPLAPLGPAEVERLLSGGAELVDVRPIDAFARAHVPGSLSIALRDAFASWLGWLVPMDRPIVFVLDADQSREELIRAALGIGYEELAGELAGGIDAWQASGRTLAHTPLLRAGDALPGPVVDVRQASEHRAGHLPGALPLELGAIGSGSADTVPTGAVFMCAHGERAMTAASLAEREGRPGAVLKGSPDAWARRTGLDLARP